MNDLISRQAVLKGISLSCMGQSDAIKAEAALVRYVKKIPSAEPERKKLPRHDEPPLFTVLDAEFSEMGWLEKCRIKWDRYGHHGTAWMEEMGKTAERKKGKWTIIEAPKGYCNYMACTVCQTKFVEEDYNFCPECGADMRGGEDETAV